MRNCIENNFARFVHILRHLGIKVSTGETITALSALSLIDLLNKEHVKVTLRATLIKNYDAQPIFDRAFESFFATPEVRQQQREEWEKLKTEEIQMIEEAEADLTYQGEKLDLTREEKLFYAQLPEEERKKIREYLGASYLPEDYLHRYNRFKPMLEYLVRGSLRYWKQRLAEEDFLCIPGKEEMDDEILISIFRKFGEEDSNLLYEDMKRIGERDLPKVTNILKKLSRKLATKISRRHRMSKKVEKIDLRRSIRSNVQYGGIIFKLKYKQKKIQKPKILLICDVSGSMARYAAFVIQFIYGLSTAVKHIESFIFAEELEYVTPFFRQLHPFEETMVKLIGKSRIWGKGTNFASSLNTLRVYYPLLLTSHTVVIIVSDTKTLELERAEKELILLKTFVKDVIWLNTLPQNEWKDLRSAVTFRQYCQMFECYTLAHLEKIIRKQFLH